jgi:hypothetical protein
MSTNGMNCELVDQNDLDTRYLSGSLSDEEAEAFEAHYFGCERCWGLVQQGLAVQAAHESAAPQAIRPSSPALPRPSSTGPALRPRAWWGLAAAAAVVLTIVGVRQLGPDRTTEVQQDVLRGGTAEFVVTPVLKQGLVTAAWPRIPEADVYRVRLYNPDGTLAAGSEIADTVISLRVDSLPALRPGTEVFWEVQALDRLRNPIARSDLTRAVLPSSSR